jgi:hypothetical protein
MFTHKFGRLCFAGVTALALGAPTAAGQLRETDTIIRTMVFPAAGALEIENFSGDVKVTGTSGPDVVIKAVRRALKGRLDNKGIDVSVSGATVAIHRSRDNDHFSNRIDNVIETSFDIQVPASARLKIVGYSSEFYIAGITGAQDLQTYSGDITVDAVAAGPAPDLSVKTHSGDVHVRLAPNASPNIVRFTTRSGHLRVLQ